MAADQEDRKRGAKARQAPLVGTHYADDELNARVRGFPSASEIWDDGRNDPVLMNPEQVIDVLPTVAEEQRLKFRKAYCFVSVDGKVLDPVVIMLRIHFLLRKYKTRVTVNRLKFLAAGDRERERLYGWHLSSHEERHAVDLLKGLYGSGTAQFREDACEIYREKFGVWLSNGTASRRARQSISSNAELLEQFSKECEFIVILRRALGDAENSSSEWPSILSGKHTPSLNKLHRIVNPKQDGVEPMSDGELVVTSFVLSFFGCTNAALVYPKLMALEDVFQVLCFFGRVNLGEIWPTVREAEAFLKHCDADCDETVPAVVRNIFAAADHLCGWTGFRVALADMCRKTIEAPADNPLPRRFGRLWPMV